MSGPDRIHPAADRAQVALEYFPHRTEPGEVGLVKVGDRLDGGGGGIQHVTERDVLHPFDSGDLWQGASQELIKD
ncbi:MAG: hypothetical protein EON58_12745 [Alphaproteobacteria bacterium]|nr:MAG: hypothetical protein EON58_12745 [Alphaproteobacteria bacterium]